MNPSSQIEVETRVCFNCPFFECGVNMETTGDFEFLCNLHPNHVALMAFGDTCGYFVNETGQTIPEGCPLAKEHEHEHKSKP